MEKERRNALQRLWTKMPRRENNALCSVLRAGLWSLLSGQGNADVGGSDGVCN